jgi:hypothetical protein
MAATPNFLYANQAFLAEDVIEEAGSRQAGALRRTLSPTGNFSFYDPEALAARLCFPKM